MGKKKSKTFQDNPDMVCSLHFITSMFTDFARGQSGRLRAAPKPAKTPWGKWPLRPWKPDDYCQFCLFYIFSLHFCCDFLSHDMLHENSLQTRTALWVPCIFCAFFSLECGAAQAFALQDGHDKKRGNNAIWTAMVFFIHFFLVATGS